MLLPRILSRCSIRYRQSILGTSSSLRFSATKTEGKDDKPIKYTTSKAFKYKAYQSFRMDENEKSTVPSYNAFIIKTSVIIFLVYFCILREENDIDQMLSRDLFEIVPELEIPMMEVEIKRLKQQGVDVSDLEKKLAELKRLDEEKTKK